MKAVVYRGPRKMVVENMEEPRIMDPRDAILQVTSAAICGSDLHMYEGRTNVKEGTIIGHEIMGVIREVGPAVSAVKPGDRVVLPFNIGCGFCKNCVRGFSNACLTANPDSVGAGYGYAGMGPVQGGQTELVRVPFADFNALKLPGTPGDELEDDYLMLADILPTAYHSTELAHVEMGSTVGIWGAGPVGLLAAQSALFKGASEVYVVDNVPERLELATKIGATAINFNDGDPVGQIKERRKHNSRIQESLRPGEEKMDGVMCAIDAVGYQCCAEDASDQEQPTQVIDDMVRATNPTGHLGIIGVFFPQDPGGVDPHAQQGEYYIPWGQIFGKGLSVGTGQAPVKKYNYQLRDLIMAGRANPGIIVSHHLDIEEAPDAYEKFDHRVDGYTKVILKPQGK